MLSTLPNLLARRDLVKALVASDLRASVARSRLGWIWWLLDPLLMMAVYWAIVAGLFGRSSAGNHPYPLFLFAALITWKHFATSVNRSLTLLRSRDRIIKSIAFPTIALPISVALSGFAYFLFAFAVLAIAAWLWPGVARAGGLLPLLQVPALMLLQLAVTAGVTMAMSCYGALLEDLRLFTGHVLRLGFYLSPGLYGVDLIEERLAANLAPETAQAAFALYMANPFAVLITGYREAVLYGRFLPAHWWLLLAFEAAALLWVGYRVYQFHDRRVIKFL